MWIQTEAGELHSTSPGVSFKVCRAASLHFEQTPAGEIRRREFRPFGSVLVMLRRAGKTIPIAHTGSQTEAERLRDRLARSMAMRAPLFDANEELASLREEFAPPAQGAQQPQERAQSASKAKGRNRWKRARKAKQRAQDAAQVPEVDR